VRKISGALFGLLLGVVGVHAAFFQAAVNGPTPPAFVGLLDQFTGLSPTWGVSAYKLTNAYSGNWGTVQRQSDNTTQTLGYLSNGKVDVATFNTFCSGTNCYLTTWVDQVNGINASQSTLANMPRVIVDENSMLAVCPQPTSSMATSFNSAVNTAKVHLFAVANAHYADSRWNQPNLPTNVITANVTSGSLGITSMSSQAGISLANGGVHYPSNPGVIDSSGFLPTAPTTGSTGQTRLAALPTGSTGTLASAVGTQTPTGSKTGDTLTFTNAILTGAWIVNGPASSTYQSSAYWGVGIGNDQVASDWTTGRNASSFNYQNIFGQGMRGQFAVYDYDTFTQNVNYNGVNLGSAGGSSTNVTYSTNTGMTLFADTNGVENTSNACFETMVLFPATETQRVSMAQFLMNQAGITNNNFTPATTSDGFTLTGFYQPNDAQSGTTAFGAATYGPDANGMSWNFTGGGYTWPSYAVANNVNNTATLWEFTVNQGDADTNITNAERAEIITTLAPAPGNHFSIYYTVNFETYTDHQGSWCYGGQLHYNDSGLSTGAPDLVTFSCLNNQFQFQTQCCVSGGSPVTTNCGSPFTLTVGTTYAVEIEGSWSTNHTSDTLTINAGPIGSSLPQICSKGPTALWDNDTGAGLKAGIYQGNSWENPGTTKIRQTNMQMSLTQNAFAGFITTQAAQPTHP
jgi:hypothetical protein